jgi:hypothetical protein
MKRFRLSILLVGLHLSLLPSVGQQPSQTAPAPSPQEHPTASAAAQAPPMKEQIRSTVAFLGVDYLNGATRGSVIGTCFFVMVPDSRLGADQGFAYLVTNRHVAQPGIDLGSPYQFEHLYLRMNLVAPENGLHSVTQQVLLSEQRHWFFPPEAAVDLAIFPIAPDQKRYAYRTIPLSMIAGSDVLHANSVDVGDSVLFAGFFSSFSGQTRMEPIVREGVIAMMPEETLDTTLHRKGRLFLADLHAFHGNSGSPVFANLSGLRNGGITAGERYILLGVISGYYPESAGFSVPAATVLTGDVRDNSGIATIVPAEELVKLLNSPEVQAERDQEIARLTKKP